jgi:hypothetical protein
MARGSNHNESVESRLNDKKKQYEMRAMQKRYQQKEMEIDGCTFHPKILPDSRNSTQK